MEDRKQETINIFGTKYTINYVDEVVNEDNYWAYGNTDTAYRTIYVSTKLPNGKSVPASEIEFTRMHEIIHAILLSGQHEDSGRNEPLVEWLARCLVSLKKQNKL